MKNTTLVIMLGLGLSLGGFKTMAAPTVWATASILSVEDCCYTIRVDIYMHFEGPPSYDAIIASGTTQVGEEGCCPDNGTFVDDPNVQQSLMQLYNSDSEMATLVDQAIELAISGYAYKEPADGLTKPFILDQPEYPETVKIATINGFEENGETTVEVYNSRGTFLRLYPYNPAYSEGLTLRLMSEPDTKFFVVVKDKTVGRSVVELEFN